MSKVHGKNMVITIGDQDISAHCNASELEKTGDEHDLTGYGMDDAVMGGGIRRGKFVCSGVYEAKATATSPKAVIDPLVGETTTVVRKAEGTGTGKPQQTFTWLVTKYVESAPVADYITWSAEGTRSGAVVEIAQT